MGRQHFAEALGLAVDAEAIVGSVLGAVSGYSREDAVGRNVKNACVKLRRDGGKLVREHRVYSNGRLHGTRIVLVDRRSRQPNTVDDELICSWASPERAQPGGSDRRVERERRRRLAVG